MKKICYIPVAVGIAAPYIECDEKGKQSYRNEPPGLENLPLANCWLEIHFVEDKQHEGAQAIIKVEQVVFAVANEQQTSEFPVEIKLPQRDSVKRTLLAAAHQANLTQETENLVVQASELQNYTKLTYQLKPNVASNSWAYLIWNWLAILLKQHSGFISPCHCLSVQGIFLNTLEAVFVGKISSGGSITYCGVVDFINQYIQQTAIRVQNIEVFHDLQVLKKLCRATDPQQQYYQQRDSLVKNFVSQNTNHYAQEAADTEPLHYLILATYMGIGNKTCMLPKLTSLHSGGQSIDIPDAIEFGKRYRQLFEKATEYSQKRSQDYYRKKVKEIVAQANSGNISGYLPTLRSIELGYTSAQNTQSILLKLWLPQEIKPSNNHMVLGVGSNSPANLLSLDSQLFQNKLNAKGTERVIFLCCKTTNWEQVGQQVYAVLISIADGLLLNKVTERRVNPFHDQNTNQQVYQNFANYILALLRFEVQAQPRHDSLLPCIETMVNKLLEAEAKKIFTVEVYESLKALLQQLKSNTYSLVAAVNGGYSPVSCAYDRLTSPTTVSQSNVFAASSMAAIAPLNKGLHGKNIISETLIVLQHYIEKYKKKRDANYVNIIQLLRNFLVVLFLNRQRTIHDICQLWSQLKQVQSNIITQFSTLNENILANNKNKTFIEWNKQIIAREAEKITIDPTAYLKTYSALDSPPENFDLIKAYLFPEDGNISECALCQSFDNISRFCTCTSGIKLALTKAISDYQKMQQHVQRPLPPRPLSITSESGNIYDPPYEMVGPAGSQRPDQFQGNPPQHTGSSAGSAQTREEQIAFMNRINEEERAQQQAVLNQAEQLMQEQIKRDQNILNAEPVTSSVLPDDITYG
jgi:hypothetical protein